MSKPLAELRVLEYGEGVTAPAAAKYMADLGAQVIKIERPDRGDIARRMGPFYQDKPNPEGSALFLFLNTNKLGITLDPSIATGRELFLKLVGDSDVLIENHPPGFMDAIGLGYDRLKLINPMLVMTSVTPFGQTGPYRDYKGGELIAFHVGGNSMETPEEVDDPPHQPPLIGGSYQASFLAAITAATATMAMVFGRQETGTGAHLDMSEYECGADNQRQRMAQYFFDQRKPARFSQGSRRPGHFGAGGLQPCKDGYVQLHIVENHMWQGFAKVIGQPKWCTDERFADRVGRAANWHVIEPELRRYTMARTKAEIASSCQAARVPCAPVNSPADLLASVHMEERGFFVEVDHPVTGTVKYPGSPSRLVGAAWSIERRAPLLGEHNENVFVESLGCTRGDLVRLRQAGVI